MDPVGGGDFWALCCAGIGGLGMRPFTEVWGGGVLGRGVGVAGMAGGLAEARIRPPLRSGGWAAVDPCLGVRLPRVGCYEGKAVMPSA